MPSRGGSAGVAHHLAHPDSLPGGQRRRAGIRGLRATSATSPPRTRSSNSVVAGLRRATASANRSRQPAQPSRCTSTAHTTSAPRPAAPAT
jgi:hypothetical protein